MVKQSVKTSVVTTKAMRLELTRRDIVKFLEASGVLIPRDAGVYVQVPGGGDWSNTSLDIDSECPIIVTWSETEETDG